MTTSYNNDEHLACDVPQYIFLSCLLGYISLAVFLKLSAIVKLVLMVVMAIGYLVVLTHTHKGLFDDLDDILKR